MSDNLKYFAQTQLDEHDKASLTKKVSLWGWDADNLTPVRLVVNDDGTIVSGLGLPKYDYIAVSYPTSSSEVFTFKSGGVSGSIVATITPTYTDVIEATLYVWSVCIKTETLDNLIQTQ